VALGVGTSVDEAGSSAISWSLANHLISTRRAISAPADRADYGPTPNTGTGIVPEALRRALVCAEDVGPTGLSARRGDGKTCSTRHGHTNSHDQPPISSADLASASMRAVRSADLVSIRLVGNFSITESVAALARFFHGEHPARCQPCRQDGVFNPTQAEKTHKRPIADIEHRPRSTAAQRCRHAIQRIFWRTVEIERRQIRR